MIRRTLLAVVVALFALVLTGCGPKWIVVVQAAPNPFVNQSRFSVLPVDFTGLEIGAKPEAVYLGEKTEQQRESFLGDKAGVNEEFTGALLKQARLLGFDVVLATGPNDAPFQLRPSVAWLEPGFYAGFVGAPSQMRMKLQIVLPDGQVLDEIRMEHRTDGSVFNAASGTRLRTDGRSLGELTAKYLNTRIHPGQD